MAVLAFPGQLACHGETAVLILRSRSQVEEGPLSDAFKKFLEDPDPYVTYGSLDDDLDEDAVNRLLDSGS